MHSNKHLLVTLEIQTVEIAIDFLRRVAPVGRDEQQLLAQLVDHLEQLTQQKGH